MIVNFPNRLARSSGAAVLAAAALVLSAALPVAAQGLTFSRASLAKTASFIVTTTLIPKGGSKSSQVMRVQVKGNKARLDFNNPAIGSVTYLANAQGVFFYVPANKVAQKQQFQGGVDTALRLAFQQVNEQLRTAKKVGTTTVSGQTTDVYKDARRGTTLYIGRSPAFRLPVKTVVANEGGTQTVLVTNIKTNITLPDSRFSVPKGVQIIESTGAAGAPGIPGVSP